ncbi:MAG: HEAT repeat domain-containing protein [Candidatus Heimdallarchaeota archaeon]|nr:MAG: HEAT repeat domain-containing protein [Candidatus Heimdallarchaeota archaeon]
MPLEDEELRRIMKIPDDQELPPDALCDVMIRALESHQLLIRSSAVNQLVIVGKSHPQMAISKILSALDPSIDYWTVRFGAVEALGEIANKSTIPPLLEYLETDEDPDFRAMVAKQLGEMRDVAKEAGSGLIKALSDQESSDIRENAALALGQIKIPHAVEPLIAALEKEKEAYARRQMCWSLGELSNSQANPVLIKTLKDKDKETRGNAAEALGKIRDSTSVLPLLAAAKDRDVDVQAKVIWALKQLSSETIVSEVENAAQGDSLVAIQYYGDYLFNVDNDEVARICKEIKNPIIAEYQSELGKIKTELERCKVFVSETFAKLANLSSEELDNLLQRDIPAIESRIGGISLYKYRKYKWIENDLFFDLDEANKLYKESGVMISELRDNVQALQKKKGVEISQTEVT